VNEFIDRSKELGIKVTPQTLPYKELASTDQHPSTETISKEDSDYYSRNISGLTTVYRALETFEKLGLSTA
jgi:Fe2+ or Zn2+ uptake regulation protein